MISVISSSSEEALNGMIAVLGTALTSSSRSLSPIKARFKLCFPVLHFRVITSTAAQESELCLHDLVCATNPCPTENWSAPR
jgi:hypothetical protein